MADKQYDEDMVVDCLARRGLTYAQIADRVGVSTATIGRIACGQRRQDLYQRIQQVRASLEPRQRRKLRGVSANPRGRSDPAPRSYRLPRKRKPYDDDLLIELIARGDLSASAIGKQVGLSASSVSAIIRGELRKDLQPRINTVVASFRAQTRRMGTRWLKTLLSKHISTGMKGDNEVARKCREFALNRFLDDGPEQSADSAPSANAPDLTALSAKTRRSVLAELGGPDEDEQAGQ
ncbi:MAG: hypothetical protein J7M14_01700 [Planctomycetes bacterium]|nr:hypothetical protein [Planctomycetota bacterium]